MGVHKMGQIGFNGPFIYQNIRANVPFLPLDIFYSFRIWKDGVKGPEHSRGQEACHG